MTYMSLCVVMTDWGNLRDEIFSRTGFAPSGPLTPRTKARGLWRTKARNVRTLHFYLTRNVRLWRAPDALFRPTPN